MVGDISEILTWMGQAVAIYTGAYLKEVGMTTGNASKDSTARNALGRSEKGQHLAC